MSPADPSVSPAVQVLVDQGITAIRQQDLPRAFDLLSNAIRIEPRHEQAWLWLSGATSDQGQRRFCLEQVLVINPNNAAAKRGLSMIPSEVSAVSPLLPHGRPNASVRQTESPSAPHVAYAPVALEVASQPVPPIQVATGLMTPQATTTPSPKIAQAHRAQRTPTSRPSLLTWSTLGVILFGFFYAAIYLAVAPNAGWGVVLVLGSGGWVYVDATRNGIRRGLVRGAADMSPDGWFGACLLLWFIAFPFYLIKRLELIRLANPGNGGTSARATGAHQPTLWTCLATTILLIVVGCGAISIISLLGSSTSASVATHNDPAVLAEPASPQITASAPSYTVQDVEVTWTITSRGFTELDGGLWVPEVRATIRNTGDRPTEDLYLRAVFFDQDRVIKGDPAIEPVASIPTGFAKGPVFLKGSIGYTNDFALLMMGEQPGRMWNYELSVSTSYGGPWETIKKGIVELPPGYKTEKNDTGPSASTDASQLS